MSTSIRTKYLGPTNYKGARIKAQLNNDGATVTISYPYELSGVDVHMEAVKALCAKLNIDNAEWVHADTDKGYIFIRTA